jgi:hypothetical protein
MRHGLHLGPVKEGDDYPFSPVVACFKHALQLFTLAIQMIGIVVSG